MKPLKSLSYLLFLFLMSSVLLVSAQTKPVKGYDIENLDPEIQPKFPGGIPAFSKFIIKNLKYPEVAALVGLTGKVRVLFVIDKHGTVKKVEPVNCLGAGCESEAVRVVSISPRWIPGTLGGKPMDTQYSLPIGFYLQNDRTKTTFKSLAASKYGFVFFIKGKTYSLSEAQAKLGDSFDPKTIETVKDYRSTKNAVPNKKAVYLVVLKS